VLASEKCLSDLPGGISWLNKVHIFLPSNTVKEKKKDYTLRILLRPTGQ